MTKTITNPIGITRAEAGEGKPRITHSDLLSLRSAQMRDSGVKRWCGQVVGDISTGLSALFAPAPAKVNSMCKYYGHIIRGAWSGELPHCADCGQRISNPDQLRKAVASPR